MTLLPPARPSVAVASLYQTYLVTRHTGRAVRLTIERMVEERPGPSLTVLDFSEVAVIDFSCADEVVARLLHDALSGADAAAPHYFLLDGIEEEHMDPVASALARRGLAMAARTSARRPVLLGRAEPEARRVWEALAECGRARATELAGCLGGDVAACGDWLARLDRRRVVRGAGDEFESLFVILGADEGRAPP
jgi:hypothetical protein